MAQQDVDDSVLRADRYSKIIALFFAVGVWGLTSFLTPDRLFNMTIAAVAGIGIRLYIPYHASVLMGDSESVPVRDYEGTGGYHHGAVGGGLVVGSLVAIGVMTARPVYSAAMMAGIATTAASYMLFRSLLS